MVNYKKPFLNMISKIKSLLKKKDVKALPEATQNIREESSTKSNSKNVFIESLRVSPEELARNVENQQKENIQIREDKKRWT